MAPNVMRWLAAIALLVYCAALAVWIGPEDWMWRVWIPAWLIFTIIAFVFVIRKANPARVVMPWAGGVAFTMVAVLSAVLEVRSVSNVGLMFVLLGLGMVGSVALFLAAYDRSKRAPAEAMD